MSNYQDKMTLDEIGDNDLEMAKDAIKNANKFRFGKNQRHALMFIKHCMDCTLKHLGIKLNPPTRAQAKNALAMRRFERDYAKQLKKNKVQIEGRKHYRGESIWRNGIYIMKDGVLVAFISNVLGDVKEAYSKDTMKLSGSSVELFVITNARTDNIGRVY